MVGHGDNNVMYNIPNMKHGTIMYGVVLFSAKHWKLIRTEGRMETRKLSRCVEQKTEVIGITAGIRMPLEFRAIILLLLLFCAVKKFWVEIP